MTELATTAVPEKKLTKAEKKRRNDEEAMSALAALPPSDYSITKDSEGYKVGYKGLNFPFASPTMVGAIDLKKRIEILANVQETCKNIEWFKRECGFYTDKASMTTTGRPYQDLFINSGAVIAKTTALTHERITDIFGVQNTKEIMGVLSEYLNTISAQKDIEMAQSRNRARMVHLAER